MREEIICLGIGVVEFTTSVIKVTAKITKGRSQIQFIEMRAKFIRVSRLRFGHVIYSESIFIKFE